MDLVSQILEKSVNIFLNEIILVSYDVSPLNRHVIQGDVNLV